jgi:hypothetical protein
MPIPQIQVLTIFTTNATNAKACIGFAEAFRAFRVYEVARITGPQFATAWLNSIEPGYNPVHKNN